MPHAHTLPFRGRERARKPLKHQFPFFLTRSLFLGRLGLGLVPSTLVAGTLVSGVASGNAKLRVGTTLNTGGDLALADLGDTLGDVGDGQGSGDGGDLVQLGDVGLGVTLLGGVGLAGQEDEALLVGLEAGHVGGEALLAQVLAAEVDGDADGGSQGLGDTGLL